MKEIKFSSELGYNKSVMSIFVDHLNSAMEVLALVMSTTLALLVIVSIANDVPSNVLQSLIWLVFIVIFVIGALGYAVIRTIIDRREQGNNIVHGVVGRNAGKGVGVILPAKYQIMKVTEQIK